MCDSFSSSTTARICGLDQIVQHNWPRWAYEVASIHSWIDSIGNRFKRKLCSILTKVPSLDLSDNRNKSTWTIAFPFFVIWFDWNGIRVHFFQRNQLIDADLKKFFHTLFQFKLWSIYTNFLLKWSSDAWPETIVLDCSMVTITKESVWQQVNICMKVQANFL